MTEEAKLFGIAKSQIPAIALMSTFMAIVISMLAIAISMMIGMRSEMNANNSALRAEMNANNNALRAEMNANNNALRAEFREDIRALDSRIDALSVEMAETNARIQNIERNLPDYDSLEARIGDIERGQALLNRRLDALSNAE